MSSAGQTNGGGSGSSGGGNASKPASGTTGGPTGKRSLATVVDPVEGLEALPDLPASERAFLTDGDIRVPVRRISVGAGEPPVDVYDPAGPRTADLHVGLPKLRQPWIDRRVARGDTNFSQMHYARRGEITEEMRFCALR